MYAVKVFKVRTKDGIFIVTNQGWTTQCTLFIGNFVLKSVPKSYLFFWQNVDRRVAYLEFGVAYFRGHNVANLAVNLPISPRGACLIFSLWGGAY